MDQSSNRANDGNHQRKPSSLAVRLSSMPFRHFALCCGLVCFFLPTIASPSSSRTNQVKQFRNQTTDHYLFHLCPFNIAECDTSHITHRRLYSIQPSGPDKTTTTTTTIATNLSNLLNYGTLTRA